MNRFLRDHHDWVDSAFSPKRGGSAVFTDDVLARFELRSQEFAPLIAELNGCAKAGRLEASVEDIARSLVHMHLNRLFPSRQRVQEAVLLQLLHRCYTTRRFRPSTLE
jgi:thiopeptide-type bacteriocin biosynthesis protein